MQYDTINYDALALVINKLGAQQEPAELHGTLTGLLCANSNAEADIWLQNLFPHVPSGDLLGDEAFDELKKLHKTSRARLNATDCEFQLLVPDDDSGLDQRVHALGEWCQGFLVGLSLGGISDFKALPEDAREIAEDIVEIARADSSYRFNGSEEDEHAYAELVEYLRVGVLLINEELQPDHAPAVGDTTLH
ncbi:MAG TPA: YecA family protein [Gammaproteobacteria bacterium]|nr:YecA family protein [Gammaproteobacteria bacterium]